MNLYSLSSTPVLSLKPYFACLFSKLLFSSRCKVLSPKCLFYFIWEGNKGKSFLEKFIDEFVSVLEDLEGVSQVNQSTFSVAEILHQLHLELT